MKSKLAFLRVTASFALLVALPASAQFPIIYTWPDSSFPCNETLQQCVSAAGPDDTVEIAINGPINESITKYGSMDLQAAFGFQPVFAADHSIFVGALPGGGVTYIRIEGLTLTRGRISVGNISADAMTAQVLNNTILASGVFAPISVTSSGTGPLSFVISGNDVTPTAGDWAGIRVLVRNGFGTGDVLENVASIPPHPNGSGILLEVEDGALAVDVMRNRVVGGSYHTGIRHRLFDAAVLDSRVLGNLVVGANAGGGAGISVEGFVSDAILDARIVNNTVFDNTDGIAVEGVDALVTNNVIASNATGLVLASPAISNDHNLFWDSGIADIGGGGGFAGPGSVFDDPRFVGANDFRLGAGSAAIDAGDSATVPPELGVDLDGTPRIFGAAVDIGAYETPEPSSTLTGVAAVLALAGLTRCRVRR